MRAWLFALPVATLVFWLAGATVDPWGGYPGIAAGVFPLAWSLLGLRVAGERAVVALAHRRPRAVPARARDL